VELLTIFLQSLGRATGQSIGTQAFKIGRELVGLEDAQLRMLRSINVKVDALITGPFRTGCRQLADALAPHRQPSDAETLLKEARTSFTTAVSQDDDPSRRSLAFVHLAVVWLMLGSIEDVRTSLREAHLQSLRTVAREVGGRSKRLFESEGQKRRRIRESIAYANALAEARRSSGTPTVSAPLVRQLRQYFDGSIIDPTLRPTKVCAAGASGALGQFSEILPRVREAPPAEIAESEGTLYENRVDVWISAHVHDPD
jgi:hypothetical protein